MSAVASSSSWSIAIKTVGSRINANKKATISNINSSNNNTNDGDGGGGEGSSENYSSLLTTKTPSPSSSGESNSFTLQVHPKDPLHSLSTKIESITGLPANKQRLIYRGRIIAVPPPPPPSSSSSSTTIIQDIKGLSDGETIHLVPRVLVSSSNAKHNSSSYIISSTSGNNSNVIHHNTTTNNDNGSSSITNNNNDDGLANALLGGLLTGFSDTANTFTTTNNNTNAANTTNNNSSFSSSSVGPNSTSNSTSTGGGGGGNTTTTNVTSLSGSEGMNLLAALLGLSSSSSSSGGVVASNNNSNGNNSSSTVVQQGEVAVAGSGQGLGGIVSRAALMGVIDDASSTTNTAATAFSSLDDLVAAADRGVADGGGGFGNATSGVGATTASGALLNRSVEEIRSSRNAATANLLNPNNNNNNANGANGASSTVRAARNRRRATAARLTASDIRIPDPGSMEPVRQGLMTLHTLLGNAELGLTNHQQQQRIMQHEMLQEEEEEDGEEKGEEDLSANSFGEQQQQHEHNDHFHHPLNSHRQWYRGQWLDVLDTVNQWLEATIVDIVLPSDLLGNYAVSRSSSGNDSSSGRRRRHMYNNINSSQQQHSPVEAVVSGNDLEGRRRLLLEPRTASDDVDGDDFLNNNNATSMGIYDLLNEGYRPRNDNDGVQLLLIHYNGWPHRWDEWIRSDSPRIRPFRTRTRHRIMSTHASPTPQGVFQAAPSTFIRDESEEVERALLLPELQRVMMSVNDVLSSVLPPPEGGEGWRMTSSYSLENDSSARAIDSSHLPWRQTNHGSEYFQSTSAVVDDEDDDIDCTSDDGYYNTSASSSLRQRPDPRNQLNAVQLRQLAPLIDRLGRTLTDAAPHIAALADALPRHPSPLPQATPVPLRTDQVGNGSESFAARASRLYFGIDAEEDDDDEERVAESAISTTATTDAAVVEVETTIDPDLTDFVNGMVNTTRGGSSRDTNREPFSSSLLASYLSSLGAGGALAPGGGGDNNDVTRVVRVGGGDGGLFGAGGGGGSGPGIDIHIHAIVTGPGMTPVGGLGGLGIGSGGTPVNRSANVIAPVTATPEQHQSSGGGMDGDEIDLFSDLYSESPPPVNLHQSQSGNRESLDRIFEECRSIEEESDSSTYSAATQPFDSKVAVANTDEDVESIVEYETILDDSELANESNDTSGHSSTIETASSPNAASRRRSSSSFGSRMYRRTFGRLSGSSRRFSES